MLVIVIITIDKDFDKICKTLDCQIHDIVDYVPDKGDVQED